MVNDLLTASRLPNRIATKPLAIRELADMTESPEPPVANRIALQRLSMRALTMAAVLGACLSLSSCALPGNDRPEFYAIATDEPYTVASGDRLRIIVFGQDSLSNAYSVDGVGRISMPLIGSVPVEGRTPRAIESEIAGRLRKGYLLDPQVSVEVEAFRPFFVLGEVANAGQYPFVEGMSARTAVAIAGGFSPRGYQGGVDITRVIDGEPVTGRVPLDTPLRPGDTITVPERIF
jgi:polysaccharide biosynthesis/export protein